MNNDELQKAIDDITKDNAPAEAAPAVDAAAATAENEQLANEIAAPAAPVTRAGVDLVPTAAPEVDLGTAPAPAVPAEPAMPPMAEAAPAPEAVAPAAEAAPEVPEIATTHEAASDDTLAEAYKALYPLLDRVDMPVEEKFDITLNYGEPAKALELAKQIADDSSKANALMKIIEKLK